MELRVNNNNNNNDFYVALHAGQSASLQRILEVSQERWERGLEADIELDEKEGGGREIMPGEKGALAEGTAAIAEVEVSGNKDEARADEAKSMHAVLTKEKVREIGRCRGVERFEDKGEDLEIDPLQESELVTFGKNWCNIDDWCE